MIGFSKINFNQLGSSLGKHESLHQGLSLQKAIAKTILDFRHVLRLQSGFSCGTKEVRMIHT